MGLADQRTHASKCYFVYLAKLTIIVNNKIDENQMGEYERPAI